MRSLLLLVALTSVAQAVVVPRLTSSTLDVLSQTGHQTFASLIKQANLTSLFDGTSTDTYTIFAPQERYLATDLHHFGLTLDQLQNDTQLLTEFLNYHIVRGSHQKNTFFNDRRFTTLSGAVIRTNHYIHNNNYFVDGSQLSSTAYQSKDGMVYSIQHLLYPVKGDIYDTIAQDPQLSTLKHAIDVAGLEQFLRDQSPITVFAPTDDAFALLGNTLTSMLAKPDLLKEILLYHVIYGSLYRGGMHDEALHTFEEKDQLALDIGRFGAKVGDARFATYDISASNGVIHKIRGILVPDDLKAQL